MKLSKLQQHYQYFFKYMKNYDQTYFSTDINTHNPNKQYTPKLSKLTKKIIRSYKLSTDIIDTSYEQHRSINPRTKTRTSAKLMINGKPSYISGIEEIGCFITIGVNEDSTGNISQVQALIYMNDVYKNIAIKNEELQRNRIDYYTEDESLIFQYNTTFDYDTIRAAIQLSDIVKPKMSIMELIAAVNKIPNVEFK